MPQKPCKNVKTIVETLKLRVKDDNEKIAYRFLLDGESEEEKVSYGDLYTRAQIIASEIVKKVSPGERVLLLYQSGIDFIEVFLGCLFAGVIAVPINPPTGRRMERLVAIIKDSKSTYIFSTSQFYKKIEKRFNSPHKIKEIPVLFTDKIIVTVFSYEFPETRLDQLAFLQYTSGSTGDPKGVMVSHHNIVHNCELIKNAHGLDKNTIQVGWLPMFHDMGLIGNILTTLYVGGTLVGMTPESFVRKPVRWLRAISDYKATISGGPNFAYDLCVNNIATKELIGIDLSSCKVFFCGAETIKEETLSKFIKKYSTNGVKHGNLKPCYGMAETTLVVTCVTLKNWSVSKGNHVKGFNNFKLKKISKHQEKTETKYVSNGFPLGDMEVRVVNPDTKEQCKEGEEGEIWVSGVSVAKGYWNRPKLSNEMFNAFYMDKDGIQNGPFLRSGDMGFLSHKELFISGRLKEMMIFNGINFFPQDIESRIQGESKYFAPNSGAVFSISVDGIERLVVTQEIKRVYLNKYDGVSLIRKIKAFILNEFNLIVYDVLLLKPATIPKTSSGKIKRNTCRDWYSNSDFKRVLNMYLKKEEVKISEALMRLDLDLKRKLLITWLQKKIANTLNIADYSSIDIDKGFFDMGLDSLIVVEFTNTISVELEIELSVPEMTTLPNIILLADHILQKKSIVRLSEREFGGEDISPNYNESIAIVSAAFRLPGDVDDLESLGVLLKEEKNTVSEISNERMEISNHFNLDPNIEEKTYVKRASFISRHDEFDAKFFGISPREAKKIDPQQRILLECSYEALEKAGFTKGFLAKNEVGVFVGLGPSDYGLIQNDRRSSDAYNVTGNHAGFAAGRLSFFLGVNGPSMVIDTACSSSLVALDLACKSLQNRESDLVIAGGAQMLISPIPFVHLCQTKALSPDGCSKPFSNKADGYGRGEGCIVFTLRRLSDAEANQEPILGIIKGTAVNHDGTSSGLTVPNGRSQEDVIKKALTKASVSSSDVSYVEAHGTGTILGDPIEINALENVYGNNRKKTNSLLVGSIKGNIGHLEAASGFAGMLKILVAFNTRELPKSLYSEVLNEHIPWDKYSISILQNSRKWETNDKPRIAGLSSFGLSGTNAHIIVQEPPKPLKLTSNATLGSNQQLLVFSAVTRDVLDRLLIKMADYVEKQNNLNLEDLAYNLAVYRNHFPIRVSILAKTNKELIKKLKSNYHELSVVNSNIKKRKLTFLFAGHGSQYAGMCESLYKEQLVFKNVIDECHKKLMAIGNFDLLTVLFRSNEKGIHEKEIAEPVSFVIGYALFNLWESFGVVPEILLGYGLGEIIAACAAQVFTLDEGLMMMMARHNLILKLPTHGSMISVKLDDKSISKFLSEFKDKVSVAALNGTNHTTISGDQNLIEMLYEKFTKLNIETEKISVSNAYHSPLMDPVLADFKEKLIGVNFKAPKFILVSCMEGRVAGKEIYEIDYWVDQLRRPIQFEKGMMALESLGADVYLEISPRPILSQMGSKIISEINKPLWLNSLWIQSIRPNENNMKTILNSLSIIYAQGFDINWTAFYGNKKHRLMNLPTYPFQRSRFWLSDEDKIAQNERDQIDKNSLGLNINKLGNPKFVMTHVENIKNKLFKMVTEIMHLERNELTEKNSLIELGADSLMLMDMIKKIESEFAIKLEFSKFFNELQDIDSLADFIVEKTKYYDSEKDDRKKMIHSEPFDSPKELINPKKKNVPPHNMEALLDQFKQQNQLLQSQFQFQNKFLSNFIDKLDNDFHSGVTSEDTVKNKNIEDNSILSNLENKTVRPFEGMQEKKRAKISIERKIFLDELIGKYNKKTSKSKEFTQQYRNILADNRASSGFRVSTKEMLYPIISDSAKGSKIYDIDGNEYIDITMGFGSCLFGHQQDFIINAIKNQLNKGMHIGPQSHLVGEVATLITELTNFERVCFANSGTEAVMIALRLARSKRKREKIVIFEGSYHGHFDGTLGVKGDGVLEVDPIATGISKSIVKDLIILDFDAMESIEIIKQYSDEIAGVLIEPIRSRYPDKPPSIKWLKALRDVTEKLNIPLIFDEIITGFRILPGGAQEYFGIKADIATYGKIAGGGMPLGVIAGNSKYLDVVDGGSWHYGDDSYPATEPTFLAGTFTKHPLTLSASKAILTKIKSTKIEEYDYLNKRTKLFAKKLNHFFKKNNLSIEVVYFGSIFKFKFNKNYDLFFYDLLNEGVYIWEGRICYLSFAHSETDIDQLYNKIVKSITKNENLDVNLSHIFPTPRKENYPVLLGQKSLWIHSQMNPTSLAYNMSSAHLLKGSLNRDALYKSFETILNRHDSLRTIFDLVDGDVKQKVIEKEDFKFNTVYKEIELNGENNNDKTIDEVVHENVNIHFDLTKGPLININLILLNDDEAILAITVHHIISDGWSLGIILNEWTNLYLSYSENKEVLLPEMNIQYKDFAVWFNLYLKSDEIVKDKTYWQGQLSEEIPVLEIKTDFPRPKKIAYIGSTKTFCIPQNLLEKLEDYSKENGITVFIILLAISKALLYKYSGQNDIAIGTPVAIRNFSNLDSQIGYYLNNLVLRNRINSDDLFKDFLFRVRDNFINAYSHQSYPYEKIVDEFGRGYSAKGRNPFYDVLIVLDTLGNQNLSKDSNVITKVTSSKLKIDDHLEMAPFHLKSKISKLDLTFFFTIGDEFDLNIEYRTDLFTEKTINKMAKDFQKILKLVLSTPALSVEQITNELMTKSEIKNFIKHKSSVVNKLDEGF